MSCETNWLYLTNCCLLKDDIRAGISLPSSTSQVLVSSLRFTPHLTPAVVSRIGSRLAGRADPLGGSLGYLILVTGSQLGDLLQLNLYKSLRRWTSK